MLSTGTDLDWASVDVVVPRPSCRPPGISMAEFSARALLREVGAFAGLTPSAVAVAPWLAMDDVAWPDSSPTRGAVIGRPGQS